VYSFFLNWEINEESLVPCYFLHGEETFLAFQFIEELKEALVTKEVREYNVERFNLDENSWPEIIDLARTIPFFLSPWRIIVVEGSKGKRENLSSLDQKLLEDYFSSPSSKTLIVIIFSGKIRKNSSLFKFFKSLSLSLVQSRELRPLKDRPLYTWMAKKFSSQGKSATPEAMRRLEELTGNDLRQINNEVEKLITFTGEKTVVELDDVNQISGWVKSFFEWEISDSLAKADFEQCLLALSSLFKEGIKPVYILGLVVRFFRDILLAKLLVKKKNTDRKAIFKELRPQIQEKFGDFYSSKFKEFFSLVDMFSVQDLHHILAELEEVDIKMKTSDSNPKTLLETFLFDYCRSRRKEKATWKEER
jgi:DNA polymerase III delta subunit